MCSSIGRWLPVFFVLGMIGWIYAIVTTDILLPLLRKEDERHERGLAFLIAFNSVFAMTMLCFLRTVFTDPGRIPEGWVVVHDAEGQDMMPPVVAQVPPPPLPTRSRSQPPQPAPRARPDLARAASARSTSRLSTRTRARAAYAARAVRRCTSPTARTTAASSGGAC